MCARRRPPATTHHHHQSHCACAPTLSPTATCTQNGSAGGMGVAQSFRAFVFCDGVFPINHTNAADLRSAEPRATNEWVREVRAALATMSMSLPERAVNYDLMRLGGVYDFAWLWQLIRLQCVCGASTQAAVWIDCYCLFVLAFADLRWLRLRIDGVGDRVSE